jgi:hypothetical protein
MSNHRKHYSEIPIRKYSKRSNDELSPWPDSITEKHKRYESEIPTNHKIATTSMTERVTNSDRAYNYTESDALKDKISPTDIKLDYKLFSKQQKDPKSAVFSELKRHFMDDDNEGLPNFLLFLKEPLKRETDPEDEYTTKGCFTKIKVDELIATVLTVNTILVCVIYYEIRKLPLDEINTQILVSLAMVSITSIFLSKVFL